ncbi:MAG: MFS transporter [Rhodobacteraceae bacterium]|jgi:MFS family permease|nr:MFS transporter [Paracoccaceae bacterium]
MDAPLGPAFRRFVAASGATNLADGIATLAWAWVASLLTRDALLVALVPVALRLPWFLFAVPAGIVTDRVDRRRLILAMDCLRALAFAAAALAVALAPTVPPPAAQGVSVPWLYWAILTAALAVGAAEVFRDNSAQTMLPALVPHARLEAANGRLWSVEMVANALIGPPLAALLIGLAVAAPFAANAAMYAAAVLLVAGLSGRFRPQPNGPRDWRRELKEGFAFLMAEPLLRRLAVVTGVWNLLHQMTVIALILFVQEVMGLGATGYGLILAAGAVGGVAGGFAAERIVRRFGPAPTAQWSLLTSAPCFLAIALLPLPLAVAATLAVFEFAGVAWNAVSVSYRQRAIPDALLGRVNSLYRLLAWGMMPVGLVASGLVVRAAEPLAGREAALAAPFWLAAAGAALLTAAAWRGLGRGLPRAL